MSTKLLQQGRTGTASRRDVLVEKAESYLVKIAGIVLVQRAGGMC